MLSGERVDTASVGRVLSDRELGIVIFVDRAMDVLFDLDGTFIDPKAGIVGSIRFALDKLGHAAPETLDWAIGPPLRNTFAKLGLPADRIESAVGFYRENYAAGAMYDAAVYPGIPEAIERLAEQGFRLIVATSKPHVYARPILAHFGLARRFAAIHGAELDGRRDDKAELIAHIVKTERVTPASALMIGDRQYDCLGASANGIAAVGALWGYGSMAELKAAGATALCDRPQGLARLVPWLLKGET